jgi:hypothetical protein
VQVLAPAGRRWQVVDDGLAAWLPGGGAVELTSVARRATAMSHPAATVTAILAAQVAHDISRYLAGVLGDDSLRIVDRDTLRTTRHPVLPHPLDGPPRFRPAAHIPDGPGLTADEFARRMDGLCDDLVGIMSTVDDGFAAQLPLRVRTVQVADPAGLLAGERLTAIGVGLDAATSRQQALLRGLAAYGSIMVDPRRFVRGDVPGVDLVDGTTRLIPAAVAFPVLDGSRPYQVPCGAAAGLSWDHALGEALRQHCLQLTVEQPLRRRVVSATPEDRTTRYCLDMLRAAGRDPTLHDVTGALGIPVVECGKVYGCGPDLTDAVRQALLAALAAYQRLSLVDAPSIGPVGSARLVQALAAQGRRPVAVALDHDPVVSDAVPFIVHVVLAAADG